MRAKRHNGHFDRQLEWSGELYRLVAEHSTEIISRHTSEGVYTYVSPACRTLLGYEPNELVGRCVYEFVYPEDLEHVKGTHAAILNRPDVCSVSYRMRRKDGSCSWFETTCQPVSDPQTSEVVEIIAVSREITEHKRMEQALRKSEEFHRFAAEAGRIGTWDLNLQTEECLISPKMAELMDYSPDQTIVPGSQWRDSVVLDDRTLMASALAASIESDAPFELEFRVALKDGTERWLYSRGSVARDPSGEALRVHGASIDVTERKWAEENLRQSEERLRRAMEIETVGIIFFRIDGIITDANDAFLRMSGYSREDLVEGLVRWDTMTPLEWMPHSLRAIEEFESTGRTIPYEKVYIRKDGSRWWGLFAARRLSEQEGVEFIIDITESKRVEEDLRESEKRFRATFEQAAVGIAHNAPNGRWLRVNQKLCDILGYTREELLPKAFQDITHPDDVEPNLDYIRRLLAAEIGSFSMEKRYIRKDGSIVWGNLTVSLVRSSSDEPGYLISVVEDITERKRAEEDLRGSNRRIVDILESITDAFFAVDHSWCFTYVNRQAEKVLRRGREELLGKILWKEFPEAKSTTFYKKYREAMESSTPVHFEAFYRPLDHWVEVHAYPSDEGLAVYFQDITERKKAEEELRFRKALLEAQTETSIDGILVVSADRRLISYNQRFVEMWDIPEEVLETRSDEVAVEAVKDKVVDSQAFLERLNYLYKHPDEDSREEIQLKDGRTFDRYSAPVAGPDGTHYGRVFFVRDITRRKRAEESVLGIRAAERRRMARDLHDVVLQDLSGTLQGLQAVQIEFDSAEQKPDLRQETDALRKAVRGLRNVIHDLRQDKEQPFVKSIEALVEYNRQATPDRQVRLSVQEDFPEELPEQVKIELLRIVQEALTNVRRHSEAQWIGVRLYVRQDRVCADVVDDGRGFAVDSVRRGLGLLGMKERIETFGGELEIQSKEDKGTMVSVTVPTQALSGDN